MWHRYVQSKVRTQSPQLPLSSHRGHQTVPALKGGRPRPRALGGGEDVDLQSGDPLTGSGHSNCVLHEHVWGASCMSDTEE